MSLVALLCKDVQKSKCFIPSRRIFFCQESAQIIQPSKPSGTSYSEKVSKAFVKAKYIKSEKMAISQLLDFLEIRHI